MWASKGWADSGQPELHLPRPRVGGRALEQRCRWRRFGAGYALIVAANIALPLSSGQLEGLGRYTAVLFPVHFWLASALPRPLIAPFYATSGGFYAFCCLLFTLVHPLL